MKKQIWVIIFALVITIGLSGAVGASGNMTSTTSTPQTTSTTEPPPIKLLGVRYAHQPPNNSNNLQLPPIHFSPHNFNHTKNSF